MQLLQFILRYLWAVIGSWFGIAVLVLGAWRLVEWFSDSKPPIPRRVRLIAFVALLFVAQIVVYKKLADNPPIILRAPVPPVPAIVVQPPVLGSETKPPKNTGVGIQIKGSVSQQGQINQIGANSQATINPDVNPNDPVVTYLFDGTKTVTVGLHSEQYKYTDQDERSAYDRINEVEQKKRWGDMASLCETEIKKAPKWPTAYECAGEAYGQMNKMNKACSFLDQTIKLAGQNKQWQGAIDMSKQFKCVDLN